MGILSSIFRKKSETKSCADIFKLYSTAILKLAHVNNSDANRLKATLYLCFAQLACIHHLAKGKASIFMDNMVEDAKNSVPDLKMKISELAMSEEELSRILSCFPVDAVVDGNTTVDGLTAYEILYSEFAEEVVISISNKTGGPLGPYGYSTILLLEALRGAGNGKEGIIEVSMKIQEMTGEVIKAFR